MDNKIQFIKINFNNNQIKLQFNMIKIIFLMMTIKLILMNINNNNKIKIKSFIMKGNKIYQIKIIKKIIIWQINNRNN